MSAGAARGNKKVTNIDTVVIGGGQAGLATGYWLSRNEVPFLILEGAKRIGDSWRQRWDSLRLFTPARYSGLPGTPYPAPSRYFPTKDEMADYLENYARKHELPVRTGARVQGVTRHGESYLVSTADETYEARNVVVAMANYQLPHVPDYAADLSDDLMQIHSSAYRNPGQLRPGPALVVGAGNSGSEISRELARTRTVYLAGTGTGQLPFHIDWPISHSIFIPLVLKVAFHRLITVDTPLGRKLRPKVTNRGGPWIRVKHRDLAKADVMRVPRVAGVKDGLPQLEDGSSLDVPNVVWCTGYRLDLSWLDLPIETNGREPKHHKGVVEEFPGLYFVGLHFQYSLSSAMIHGVGRDAQRIAKAIVSRHQESAASGRAASGGVYAPPGAGFGNRA